MTDDRININMYNVQVYVTLTFDNRQWQKTKTLQHMIFLIQVMRL